MLCEFFNDDEKIDDDGLQAVYNIHNNYSYNIVQCFVISVYNRDVCKCVCVCPVDMREVYIIYYHII